ncbi:MAG: hypothetical protein LUD00_00715 [Prevotellaceae bacterium]|nr:hypothetical protein [Prevotellaceae bacterium]
MKNSIIALALMASGLCSCQEKGGKVANNPSATSTTLGVNDSIVMKYVTCPKSTIDTLIAKGDSVYAQTNKYSLENLGFGNEEYNKCLIEFYGDTIPVAVSICDTYDIITSNSEDNETNASFIWHEVAKMQLTRFLGKDGHEVTEDDINKAIRVMSRIFDYYSGGSQYEMNMSAARQLLIADYQLLDAYKRLMDEYFSIEIKKLVHADYKYLLDTCSKYMEYRYERDQYSDLPREMRCMFYDILTAKAASINRLMKNKASEQSVIKNLREHVCFEDGKFFNLTYNMLKDYYTNDY